MRCLEFLAPTGATRSGSAPLWPPTASDVLADDLPTDPDDTDTVSATGDVLGTAAGVARPRRATVHD
jgi:hypothetical protein